MKRKAAFLGAFALFFVVLALSACQGCRTPSSPDGGVTVAVEAPAARLYLVSDFAGALEPCGCVKDQLGGMDHFGVLVAAGEKLKAKGTAVVAAGPLFFMDMELDAERRAQEVAKAETIAGSLKSLGLLAFAPGRNDWSGGTEVLKRLTELSGAPLLAGNVDAADVPKVSFKRARVGSVELGIIGVAAPDKAKVALPSATSSPAGAAVQAAVAKLKADGVHAIVVLAAVGRGEAKRIADENPELLAIVVGSVGGGGDANTQAPPAERIGEVLVVETANHLQTTAIIELYPRDLATKPALVKFADATGIERTRKREELTGRIDELRARIATWSKDKSVSPADVEARRSEVSKLEAERDALQEVPAPTTGSYFRYFTRDVRAEVGVNDAVKVQMLAYYKKVNEANKIEFASRRPQAPAKGEPAYAGTEACSTCHDDARKVWEKTAHAHAYETLSKQFKEFNLDCVSCHVTGYDRPGGSTVTHVEELKNVQCETCHGPGSLHAAAPEKAKIPIARPSTDSCLACHHPPHVHTFDAKSKLNEILGPGHGRPK